MHGNSLNIQLTVVLKRCFCPSDHEFIIRIILYSRFYNNSLFGNGILHNMRKRAFIKGLRYTFRGCNFQNCVLFSVEKGLF